METVALNDHPPLTIGQVSKITGVSTHSVRLYEREGLVNPRKSPTGQRFFSDIDVELLKTTRRLITSGLNFAGIRRLYATLPCHVFKPCCIPRLGHCSIQDLKDQPCWSVEDSWCRKTGQICQDCKVYHMATQIDRVREQWSNTYSGQRKESVVYAPVRNEMERTPRDSHAEAE